MVDRALLGSTPGECNDRRLRTCAVPKACARVAGSLEVRGKRCLIVKMSTVEQRWCLRPK